MKSLIEQFDIGQSKIEDMLSDSIGHSDDGELYAEYSETEALVFDNGKLKTGTFNTAQGFGLRSVAGEVTAYAHSGDMSEAGLKRACDAVRSVRTGTGGTYAAGPKGTNRKLYSEENPIGSPSFEEKVKLLETIDAHARNLDDRVRQVTVSLAANWQLVEILRADGYFVRDIRPLVRIGVNIVAGEGDRQETGSYGFGGRAGFGEFIAQDKWQFAVDEALRMAFVNLEAVPAPAGTFDIVLGAGWPGVMLHEAVGHGLEGDFNRKKTSAFSDLMGKQVASKGVTVVDNGTIDQRRGSLSVDDEGTPTNDTVLIEDGILVGYMQDRQNARLMGVESTGNGRRESYAHQPMPRMTNTYMTSGEHDPKEILDSVKDGIYAVSFGGGQVDITSGKFVFDCTEAYEIKDGKVGRPLKGANLIGSGPEAMQRIAMVGNDMALDTGIGMCGKQGQSVPVGVGQPTLRMNSVTVGGTGV
ncbi:MAG: metalloprotease TldD [Pseudomonadota bacterium]